MKTPKAKKLPSGNWNVQIQIDGKRHSCTGVTKKEAQDKAKMLFAGAQFEKKIPLTLGAAIDKFIESKSSVLSPSTIRGYTTIRNNHFPTIINKNISELTSDDIQLAIGNLVIEGKSPKTVKNAHGLLSAVLKAYRPGFILSTKLPQKKKRETVIPTEEEMQKIWKKAKGTDYELPILLASWLGLRQSEIKGLKYSDIRDGRIHIQRAVVKGKNGSVEKGTKTVAGDRWVTLPEEISVLIINSRKNRKPDDYICPMSASAIYENFVRICEKAAVGPFRFHDLRHFAASEAHALNVPDKYAMKRMGHSTDNMLKTVYQHTMRNKEDEFGAIIDQKMADLYKSADKNADEKRRMS